MDQRLLNEAKRISKIRRTRLILFQILTVVYVIILFFLILGFIFRIFGADPTGFFVAFIYAGSEFWKIPFYSIIPGVKLSGDALFDNVSLIALFSYTATYLFILTLIYLWSRILIQKRQMDVEQKTNIIVVDRPVEIS